jgi:hypothetical protein
MLTSIALERKKVTFGQTDSGLLYLPWFMVGFSV